MNYRLNKSIGEKEYWNRGIGTQFIRMMIDFAFNGEHVAVLSIKPDNEPENHCRNGLEVGDTFTCEYGCPDGFCSKSMLKLFPLMEAVRSGGDLRNLGGRDKHDMEFDCPDGVVRFRLEVFENAK